MKIEVRRSGSGFRLEGTNEKGNQVVMDNPFVGKTQEGASPMELLLMAVAGCSAIDIITILEKQKITLDDLFIEVVASRVRQQSPAYFNEILIHFQATGEIPEEKLIQAASLSMKKYCTVAKILEKSSTISHKISLNGQPVTKKGAPVEDTP